MSFAQEMKDFMSGWTAVNDMSNKSRALDLQKQEIENLKAYREEGLKLDREQLELSRSNADRNYALAVQRNAIAREAAAAAEEADAANDVLEGLGDGSEESALNLDWTEYGAEPVSAPVPAPAEAVPAGVYVPQGETGGQLDAMGNPIGGYRRGGLVARAAEGGLLEEDPDMPFVDKQNPYVDPKMNEKARRQGAIPTAPLAEQAPPPRPQREAQPDPKAAESVAASAQAAVADAAPALIEDAKAKPAAVGPEAETERMDIINNRGGLSMEEYKQLLSTIDPNDSIPAYLKSAAALSSAYNYFMEKGQPAKAQRIAKGILILNKQMTQTLGALAQNAMEDGNIESAAQLVSDAANQFPTGDQFKVSVTPNGLTYTQMRGGEEVGSGQLSTDQLWELTGKVKDGSLFIQEMGRLAQPSGQAQVGPVEALNMTTDAYVRAMQAQEALALATEEGASDEELNRLRDQAKNANATYNKYYNNSIAMGLDRNDIVQRAEQKLEMAIPMAEQPEDGMFSSQEGGVTSGGNTVQFDELPAPKTEAEVAALPPTVKEFIAPNGQIKRNPNYKGP